MLYGWRRFALWVSFFLGIGFVNWHCSAVAIPSASSGAAIPLTKKIFPTETPTYIATATLFVPAVTSTPTRPPTPNPLARAERIPILMYHHISSPPPGADTLRVELSVPPDVFAAEMKYLAEQGYHTIHLADLAEHFRNKTPLPAKPIILTFDDGYDDNYTNAFPILKNFGLVGTFFIITRQANANTSGYMTWAQIQEMAAQGMEIGGHSVDHNYNLGKKSLSVQTAEIKPASADIAAHVPNQAPVFSYPAGSYNAITLNILRQLGYVAAVTTKQSAWQYANLPLELRRIRVRSEWGLDKFIFWLDYWTR